MSVRSALALLLALSSLTFLAACGSSGNGITRGQCPPSGCFGQGNLNGTYVFSVSGIDVDGDAYTAGGTIIANGTGGITGGTLDLNDTALGSPVIAAPVNNSGSYTVGQDGRGTFAITLPSGDNPFGSGALKFDFVLQNSFHGQVTEFDGNATASGTLDSQTASTTPAGSYAFSLSGATYSNNGAFATVGNFTLNGSSISAGLEDFNAGGVASTNGNAGYSLSGTVVAGGSSSSLSQLITTPTFGPGTITFDVYPIDSSHLKLIEVDSYATLSGDAFTESTSGVPSGNLVFTLSGLLSGTTPFAAGGVMITSAGTIASGSTEDYNNDGTASAPGTPASFTGTYSGANGRFGVSLSTFFPSEINAFVAYPWSGGLLLLETDDAGITTGAAYAQTAGASFAASQGYGLNLNGENESGEVADIAEFAATASGTSCTETTSSGNTTVNSDVIDGVVDENSYTSSGTIPTGGMALCGTYGSIDTTRVGLTYYAAGLVNGGAELTAYTVDGTTFPFIESDSGQVSAGVFILQNASATSPSVAKPQGMFVPPHVIQSHPGKQNKQIQK